MPHPDTQISLVSPGLTRLFVVCPRTASLKRVVRKHLAHVKPIHITTTPHNYPVTSTGWAGIRDKPSVQHEHTLAELHAGVHMMFLGGRPKDADFLALSHEVAEFLEAARSQIRFTGRQSAFSSVSTGISFGSGQEYVAINQVKMLAFSQTPLQVPGNLALPAATSLIMRQFFATPRFCRIAGFANGLFRTAVRTLYVQTLGALIDHHAGLTRNLEHRFSAFAAATLNFGPVTVILPHIDTLNLAWAGSTILIPSAILRHSNVGIAANERRYSFTQYSAAGMFRWVDNGFRSDVTVAEDIRDNLAAQALARQGGDGDGCW
ncbi:hypothetical protein K438DRAFT_2002046 [Mycena galopus ATCC 62051]|nr:hypothetical protein K438DRAFT_2002046 [Mycena galopus ATCC 62051]